MWVYIYIFYILYGRHGRSLMLTITLANTFTNTNTWTARTDTHTHTLITMCQFRLKANEHGPRPLKQPTQLANITA